MEQDLQASSALQDVDETELTNEIVTVSRLQVALRSRARRLQIKFSDIALQANTATPEGLFELLQETAKTLLENADFWTHVMAGSQTVDSREEAEALFNQFSLQERAKFSAETLTNVNGVVTQQPVAPDHPNEHSAYIVVTLLLGTADDEPLFNEIYSTSLLRDVLSEITLLRSHFLLAFELLWTPQDPIDSLTDADLAAHYADLVPIA
ncbi:DUF1517 domain-containing protein [Stenomitos frigidus]|uniref:DUF1517 domain-containing protein n=1 Tax=Stenomitos frigidus ULC18 TaxID=2107698 RepID=A0A2T1ESW8_9CYAN|nr:DUF1517 domain-containing protein [Stenomitos frigidus]PSB35850.1 hypothetical protein C7B82_00095 [Stenomitos frigidus ULC18]